jgi:hypothetical protein
MRRVIFLGLVGAILLALPAPREAEARRSAVERRYAGKVVLLKKRPPMRFSSQSAWIRFLRVNKMKYVWPKNKQKSEKWKFEFMAFFRRPLNDVEVKVRFTDVTDVKKFIAQDSFYLDRGMTIFASNIEVERPPFAVNRKYLMQISSARGTPLASTTFWLRGIGEVYSGRVTFTEEEARKKN